MPTTFASLGLSHLNTEARFELLYDLWQDAEPTLPHTSAMTESEYRALQKLCDQAVLANVVPPGEHACDPGVKDIDAIGFALERIQTHLVWIAEHHATFQALRYSDPQAAEKEMPRLEDSNREAWWHLQRLKELLLAGYHIDPNKRLPHDLNCRNLGGLFQPPPGESGPRSDS